MFWMFVQLAFVLLHLGIFGTAWQFGVKSKLGHHIRRFGATTNYGVQSVASPTTTKELANEAMSFFINDPDISYEATSGGVNNYVLYVTTSKQEKYILRIYNNGNDSQVTISLTLILLFH